MASTCTDLNTLSFATVALSRADRVQSSKYLCKMNLRIASHLLLCRENCAQLWRVVQSFEDLFKRFWYVHLSVCFWTVCPHPSDLEFITSLPSTLTQSWKLTVQLDGVDVYFSQRRAEYLNTNYYFVSVLVTVSC